MRLFDVLMFPTWNRGEVIRTSDFMPPKLIKFIDELGRAIEASVWSAGPRGSLWVVPLDTPDRKLTLVRQLNRTFVLDHRDPEKSSGSSP